MCKNSFLLYRNSKVTQTFHSEVAVRSLNILQNKNTSLLCGYALTMFLTYIISLTVRTADIQVSLIFVLDKTKLEQSECKYSSIIPASQVTQIRDL